MPIARNLTLEDFYLLRERHAVAPIEPQEDEDDEFDEDDEDAEEEEGEALVIEGDEEADEDEEDEEVNAGETDSGADSDSVRRLMVSSRPRRRRSPAALRPRSAAPAPRRSGTRGG
jgi:hypothetical protein